MRLSWCRLKLDIALSLLSRRLLLLLKLRRLLLLLLKLRRLLLLLLKLLRRLRVCLRRWLRKLWPRREALGRWKGLLLELLRRLILLRWYLVLLRAGLCWLGHLVCLRLRSRRCSLRFKEVILASSQKQHASINL